MAELPVKVGDLTAVPPALRYRIHDVLLRLPPEGVPLEGVALERLARLIDDGEPWFGADPSLAEVGYWMIEARHAVETRRRGCIWLTRFPSAETAKRLAKLVADPATPGPVREQATWSLGYRQIRALHPSTQWTADAIQIADEALGKLADAMTSAGKITSEQLPHALRHVQSDMIAALFAKAPGLWGDAIECFATPPLARVLTVSIGDIPAQHRLRVLRLIGATLGHEAVTLLVSRASDAPVDEQLEMLFLAIGIGGEKYLPRLEDALRGMKFVDLLRQRARWHLTNPGVVPTVRGLRIARSTAVMPAAERAAKCRQAADDLGALTKFARHPEAYLYSMWGWMVRGANDPARARELVNARPESQELVRDLYLEDLAKRGRIKQLTAAAQTLQAADVAALQLAIHGRPLAALELAATARLQTPELVCARALACYRAGRPDLTDRILAEDLPPSEITGEEMVPFPGPHESWMIANVPAKQPAIGALAKGRAGVVALAAAAPEDAEADTPSLEAIAAIVRRLGRGLVGSTVYLAGEFKYMNRDAIAAAIEKAGARLVNGPFPGTDYYVHGDWCLVQTIAQLERQGARRLRKGEIEGI
ncbi:MAG: hypothetical protein H0T42_29920 [Deltaproteobacteria bacterium]|nr:hypothetical protein [Deltaproteobacteria bacterium]